MALTGLALCRLAGAQLPSENAPRPSPELPPPAAATAKTAQLPPVPDEDDNDDAPRMPVPGTRAPAVANPTPAPSPTAEPTATPGPAAGALVPDANAKAATPIYMRKLDPMNIFDPGRGEGLSPLQAAAERLAEQKKVHERRSMATVQHMVTTEYKLTGATQEEIREQAETEALVSAAARLYFENYVLLGRDLLEPYLRQNGKQFIARTEVLDRHIVSRNSVGASVQVSVNLDALYHDLNEKHFIAEPDLRPVVSVHLNEIVEGTHDTSAGGRTRVEQTMDQNLFRVSSRKMRQPGLDVDLSSNPELLKEARFEAERNGVSVLVTGTLAMRGAGKNDILYDPFAFTDASVVLRMYRVDTGELLGEVRDSYSAAGGTGPLATRNVLDAMLNRATQRLADRLRDLWGPMMLQEASYRLMISGVAPEKVVSIFQTLKSFGPDVHVFQKAYYGDVLVVNVDYPKNDEGKFVSLLRDSVEPQFSVTPIDKHHIALELL